MLLVCNLHQASSSIIEIPRDNLFVPNRLGANAKLTYNADLNEFMTVVDGKSKPISKYNVSRVPENLSEEQLKSFLKVGYFSLGGVDDDYSLQAYIRVLGGNPVVGLIAGVFGGAALDGFLRGIGAPNLLAAVTGSAEHTTKLALYLYKNIAKWSEMPEDDIYLLDNWVTSQPGITMAEGIPTKSLYDVLSSGPKKARIESHLEELGYTVR